MKTNHFLLILSTLSLFMVSCNTLNSRSEDTIDDFLANHRIYNDRDFYEAPIELKEFATNYQYLDLFYINAHTKHELGKPEDYYGRSEGTLFEKLPFGDVYYMYNQMSCLFTNYYDPTYYEQIAGQLFYSEKTTGFGMDYDTLNRSEIMNAVVANVYLNGPADKAGIKVGDTLLTINDKEADIYTIMLEENSSVKKTPVNISLKRGDDTISVSVANESYLTPSVFINYIGDIPIITVTEFVDTTTILSGTYGEFKEALKRTEGARATIINLADNGGGSVDHCMPMAAELLPKNTVLGYTVEANIDSSRDNYRQRIDTTITLPSDFGLTEDGAAKDRYIVFVQNDQTASCSELMISAVTASKNAPVVGTQSYGKGIGQFYFETVAGGICGITGLQFYDKNMKSYHSYGIEPDFIEHDTKKALFKAYEIASEGSYVRTAGYSPRQSGNFAMALKRSQPGTNVREAFGAFKVKQAPKFSK